MDRIELKADLDALFELLDSMPTETERWQRLKKQILEFQDVALNYIHITKDEFNEYNVIKPHLKELKEKAEKYDNIKNTAVADYLELEAQNKELESQKNEMINGKYGLVDLTGKISKLRDENRKLKEEIKTDNDLLIAMRNTYVETNQELQKYKSFVESVKEKIYFYENFMPEYLKDHPEIRDEIVKNFKQLIEELKDA